MHEPVTFEAGSNLLDRVESIVMDWTQVECPVKHHFIPGFYIRATQAPAGTFIISKIHKKKHTFQIVKGKVSVWDEKNGVIILEAGDCGVTMPGTRRALQVHEDVEWLTFHRIDSTDLHEIEKELIENRPNPLLTPEQQFIMDEIKKFHSQVPTLLEEAA